MQLYVLTLYWLRLSDVFTLFFEPVCCCAFKLALMAIYLLFYLQICSQKVRCILFVVNILRLLRATGAASAIAI